MVILRRASLTSGLECDIAIEGGVIVAIGERLAQRGTEIDCTGCTALPGLHDHHIHLLATAARRRSLDLGGLRDASDIAHLLATASPGSDGWIRAIGYDERVAGLVDAAMLDRWQPKHPVRLQDRTGALWILNGRGLALIGGGSLPPGAERDASGHLNGRFWRADQWLAAALGGSPPDLAELGNALARYGITDVTDAGAGNDNDTARILGSAHLAGELPQRLTVMGSEELGCGAGFIRGALKLMIDERDPPDVVELARRIGRARRDARPVAAHCVTDVELAIYLAALSIAGGARAGDRIEHGALIDRDAISVVGEMALIVVTNPAFIHARGQRYLEEMPQDRHHDLYRAASLLGSNIQVLGASDAPYGPLDPWLAMRTARDRRTQTGVILGGTDRVGSREAHALYGGTALEVGAAANLILCRGQWKNILADLSADRVALTLIGGSIRHQNGI